MNMQEKNESANNFEQCIKCTICTAYCPVVPVNPIFPGPKQAGPDGERLRLKSSYFFDDALKYCMNCKRCDVSCPSGVKISDIIQSARIKYGRHKPKLRDMMLASTDLVGTLARPFAPIVNSTISTKPVKAILDGVMAIDHRRMFPKYAGRSFESWFRKEAGPLQSSFRNQISYFHGCYVNYNYPQLGKDFVKVMNAIGFGVNLLDHEKCCGVAMISNGMMSSAKKHAVHNVKVLKKAADTTRKILATSSTCTLTIRDEYPNLLKVDNSDVRNDMEIVTKFIYPLVAEGKVKLVFKKGYKAKVAYHVPCHMERLGWGIFSAALLKMIPGIEFTMLDSNCCGIAGTYGFKKENYEASQAIGKPLFDQINGIDPDFVTSDCETCKWQIEMSTKYQVKHPISILAEALDLEATAKLNK
ncbi:MAG: anaerobic glycerol-3-phosphate dehydrogenase subunit C [Bacteroidales bacterium]|jgi:glycerol-3-phosphate dehydrogenase subunit C|nr:anaerobic glycerol-3-phosphate dehydrogenase subunit C [Bacteroidales bacterium]MCI1786137.1 anaerobic glycerol-3-phosphate dehydrogenase subunit C [Bacteroidales bacterium]